MTPRGRRESSGTGDLLATLVLRRLVVAAVPLVVPGIPRAVGACVDGAHPLPAVTRTAVLGVGVVDRATPRRGDRGAGLGGNGGEQRRAGAGDHDGDSEPSREGLTQWTS